MNYLLPNGKKAVKLRTVNVLEFTNNEFQQAQSFADTREGNKRAEKLFRRMVLEQFKGNADLVPPDAEDMDAFLDNGIFDEVQGYQVLITHSL